MDCVDPVTRAHSESPTPNKRGRSSEFFAPGGGADSIVKATERNVRRMRDAGIEIAVGTDAGNPGTVHGPSMYREMEALQHGGMPASAVFSSATLVAAKAMDASASWARSRRANWPMSSCSTPIRRRTLPTRDGYAGWYGVVRCTDVRSCFLAIERRTGAAHYLPKLPPSTVMIAFRPLLLALLAVPSLGAQSALPRKPATEGQPPTLVVFITVDQLRADYLDRFRKQLTGGLGRLLRGGAVMDSAFQDHAVTETAPGHSVTMSGRYPASTGIREEQHRSGRSESAVDRCAW